MPGGQRFIQGFTIHVADHEHAMRPGILNNSGNEAALFIEVERLIDQVHLTNKKPAVWRAVQSGIQWIETRTRPLNHRTMAMVRMGVEDH